MGVIDLIFTPVFSKLWHDTFLMNFGKRVTLFNIKLEDFKGNLLHSIFSVDLNIKIVQIRCRFGYLVAIINNYRVIIFM